MKIRKATVEDLPAIVEMLSKDVLGQQREAFSIPLPASYIEAFTKIEKDTNHELVVLEAENGEVAGTLQLSFLQYLTYQGGIRAQIENVRIREDQRNKGLGAYLIQWAIERSKEKGAHVVQLTSDKRRVDAIRFYENLGFKCSHEGMKFNLIP